MSTQEKPVKISKLLRCKAQEFLTCPKKSENLLEIVRHFDSGADLSACLLTLELIFTNLLKNRVMYIEVVPLKPVSNNEENQYKEWLRKIYEHCFEKIVSSLENDSHKIQLQGLSTAMAIIAYEGQYPLENKGTLETYVPLNRLKLVLIQLLSNKQDNSQLINKYTEYLLFNDIMFFTWKIMPSVTAKTKPNQIYILNYLFLLGKLQLDCNLEGENLCGKDFYNFDVNVTKKCLNKLWHCVMIWEHTPATHRQLLIVLLERVLPNLEKPLLLTDFLMDSMDAGGAVALLALQGIFTMIQVHNLDYPDIFAKLYSMFEPEIFHTKYKARLFHLSDLFLSSTHLPEGLVAAFAKRLARLALIAPSEDIITICMFIGNLILRHPGLKSLLSHPQGGIASADPYIMDERDPMKSNALSSSLWEILTLQQHAVPSVAQAARFIGQPLPNVEWDIGSALETTSDDIFDKELKKYSGMFAMAFAKPDGSMLIKGEKIMQYWKL